MDGELLPSGECGENLIWRFDVDTGMLSFTGDGDIVDCATVDGNFTYLHRPWYAFVDIIKCVELSEGITSIGIYAFDDCTALSVVELHDSVKLIGQSAFRGCTNLTDVYYSGTQEQMNKITVERYNNDILDAKLHLNYQKTEVIPTCTNHGYIQYSCDLCGICDTDYTSNPTGHTLNEDGVCEVCGEKEVSTNHVNPQMLSIESVFAMIISLLAKLFGIFSVT